MAFIRRLLINCKYCKKSSFVMPDNPFEDFRSECIDGEDFYYCNDSCLMKHKEEIRNNESKRKGFVRRDSYESIGKKEYRCLECGTDCVDGHKDYEQCVVASYDPPARFCNETCLDNHLNSPYSESLHFYMKKPK